MPSVAAISCGPDQAPGPAQPSRADRPSPCHRRDLRGYLWPLSSQTRQAVSQLAPVSALRFEAASRSSHLPKPAKARRKPRAPTPGLRNAAAQMSACRGSLHSNVGATHMPFIARPRLSIHSNLDHRFSPNFTSTHQVSHALSRRCQRFIDIQRFPRYPSTTA